MKLYQLRSTQNQKILFEGRFASFKETLEQAVRENVPLFYADLRHQNLINAQLDAAILPHATFANSNLSGANVSEAYLTNVDFSAAALYNACLCESIITNANFNGTFFGGTDIFGSIISQSQFSTLSAFTLDFQGTLEMKDCTYINTDGRVSKMSKPPVVVNGLSRQPLVIMDDTVKAGSNIIDHKRLAPLIGKLSTRIFRQRLFAA